jgi:hypothetical protein
MKIIDQFLDQKNFNQLKELICGNEFPWYFYNGVNLIGDGYCQFVHTFYENDKVLSGYFNLMLPFLEKLKCKTLVRIKTNLLTKTEKNVQHGYHIDFDNTKTAIFYILTTNGKTYFKDKDPVDCKENRIVIFDSKLYHSSSTSTDSNQRIVINFNYHE